LDLATSRAGFRRVSGVYLEDGNSLLLGLVLELPVEFPTGPGREAATHSAAAATALREVEVLEGERGSSRFRLANQHLRQKVQPLNDPTTFSPALPSEESPAHPPVVRLLSTELPPTDEVSVLDRSDVRVRDDDGLGEFGFDQDSVQRPLVGVQSENGEGGERIRDIHLEHENRALRVESELLDAAIGKNGTVPI
jgi:hypothetical protein